MCLIEARSGLLVLEGETSRPVRRFTVPLRGGAVGTECVVQGLRDEIGAEIEKVNWLGTVERWFTCYGDPGHETVLVQ
jgi:hypothetical protein